MKDHIDVNNLDGGRTTIRAEELESLAAKLRGCVMLEGDPGFDVARTIWNGMIDRKPSLIVQAAGPDAALSRSTRRSLASNIAL